MTEVLRFIRGHCGWDTVTLLPEGQIPPQDELDASLKILDAPHDGGLEVGWLGRGPARDEITLRMVSSTARDWIPMCGGMTQVIGKALVETFLREHFAIDVSRSELTIRLLTPSGVIPIRVGIQEGRCSGVVTRMDDYAASLYREGIEPLELEGVSVLRVGSYGVIRVEDLENVHPRLDFTRRDWGPHLDVVNGVLRAFGKRFGFEGVNGMMYDARPEGSGQYRVFPRFYSPDLAAARIPWEFQCGTGGVAVAAALVHAGLAVSNDALTEVVFEWGSQRVTADPYGIRTSLLALNGEGRRLTAASFSHSVIEILSEGFLRLPVYGARSPQSPGG